MLTLRKLLASDWGSIAELADRSVSHVSDALKQTGWVEKRRSFQGVRRHYVVECDGSIEGYGSLERPDDSAGWCRLFLVLPWNTSLSTRIADQLLSELRLDMDELQANLIWLREYAYDQPFIDFLVARGFEITKEYEYKGQRLINLVATERFFSA